jgi:hypothetical protein
MTIQEMAYHVAISGIYCSTAPGSGTPPLEINLAEIDNISFQPEPHPQPLIEEFDWNDKKTNREFVRLEQKVLAKVAESDDVCRYQKMRQHRNSKAFAERELRDYQEIRRLKQLSQKLSELQQYVRPIKP